MQKAMSGELLCNKEQGRCPDQGQHHIIEEECCEIGVDRLLAGRFGKGYFGSFFLYSEQDEKREESESDENVADEFSERLSSHSSPFLFVCGHDEGRL